MLHLRALQACMGSSQPGLLSSMVKLLGTSSSLPHFSSRVGPTSSRVAPTSSHSLPGLQACPMGCPSMGMGRALQQACPLLGPQQPLMVLSDKAVILMLREQVCVVFCVRS